MIGDVIYNPSNRLIYSKYKNVKIHTNNNNRSHSAKPTNHFRRSKYKNTSPKVKSYRKQRINSKWDKFTPQFTPKTSSSSSSSPHSMIRTQRKSSSNSPIVMSAHNHNYNRHKLRKSSQTKRKQNYKIIKSKLKSKSTTKRKHKTKKRIKAKIKSKKKYKINHNSNVLQNGPIKAFQFNNSNTNDNNPWFNADILTKKDLLSPIKLSNNNESIKSPIMIEKIKTHKRTNVRTRENPTGNWNELEIKKSMLSNSNNKSTYHLSLKKDKLQNKSKIKTIHKKKTKISSTAKKSTSKLNNNNKSQSYRKYKYKYQNTNVNVNSNRNRSNSNESSSKIDTNKNMKCLKISDIKIKSLLGEGAFSKVYLVSLKNTNNVKLNINDKYHYKNYAMKIIPTKNNNNSNSNNKEFQNLIWERYVLKQLNHPFIVNFYGSFIDSSKVCILLDFIIGGEILYHFESSLNGKFTINQTKFYIGEIICGLSYLHKYGFIYRDLKPENILLDSEGHIKFVDFGFCKKLKSINDKTSTLCGSKEYVAPEVLLGKGSFSSDYWSLGVLTYEFITGQLPFNTQQVSPLQVLDIIKSTNIYYPSYITNNIKDFISKLLIINPKKRLGNTINDKKSNDMSFGWNSIKLHPFFNKFNWDKCNKRLLKPPIKPNIKHKDDTSNYATARFDYNNDNNTNNTNDTPTYYIQQQNPIGLEMF